MYFFPFFASLGSYELSCLRSVSKPITQTLDEAATGATHDLAHPTGKSGDTANSKA